MFFSCSWGYKRHEVDRFFSQNQGVVEIYWKEFETEDERKVVETLLTKILNPTFLSLK